MKGIKHNAYWLGWLRRQVLPVMIWLATIGFVVGLFFRRSERFEVLGIAQAQTIQIAPTVPGRLQSVSVRLFEKVSKGQILAVLDDELLQAELATASAEVQRLMAELVATQDSLQAEAANQETTWIADRRRFFVDVENARLRILELKTVIETDRIILQDLALEVKIARELIAEEAIAPYELQKAQALYNALATKIVENQRLLAQAEDDLKQAGQRRREFTRRQPVHPSVDSALELIRKAITVQERTVEHILARISELVLESPFDGVVTQIPQRPGQVTARQMLRRSGESVLAGEPILTVTSDSSSEVIAYIGEDQVVGIREGMEVLLIKDSEPQQIAPSLVSYIGPVTEEMPVRLWRNPNFPQWGRPFLVKVPQQMELTPGELVGIRRL